MADTVRRTSNLGLRVRAQADSTDNFIDYRMEISGYNNNSNMELIDAAVGKLQNSIIYSTTQPTTQAEGDTWNEILSGGE